MKGDDQAFSGNRIGPVLVMTLITNSIMIQYFINPPQLMPAPAEMQCPYGSDIQSAFRFPPSGCFPFIRDDGDNGHCHDQVQYYRFLYSKKDLFPGLVFHSVFFSVPEGMILNPAMPAALLIMLEYGV